MSVQELSATRERIVEAAGPVFAAKGFRDATIREISSVAGVNLAAVNYHFGDKEHLYIAVVMRAHHDRTEKFPLPRWSAATPMREKLRGFVHTLLGRMLAEPDGAWHTQLILREIAQPSSACEELVRDYIRPHFELMSSVLGDALPADVPESQRHLILFSIVGQCLYYRVARPVIERLVSEDEYRTLGLDRLTDHITRFTLSALGVEPPLSGAEHTR